MITIEYCKEGLAISDFEYQKYVDIIKDYIMHNNDFDLKVSTEVLVNAIRVEIYKGNIDCNDIGFMFEDKILYPDKDGRIQNWPNGFCDINLELIEKLLDERSS